MIATAKSLAKRKPRFRKTDSLQDSNYDHRLQRSGKEMDPEKFRISMKSDTLFDNESDKGDEK